MNYFLAQIGNKFPWTLNQTAPQFVAFNNGLNCVMEPLLLEARCEISDIPLTSDTLIEEKYQKEENKKMTFFSFVLLLMYYAQRILILILLAVLCDRIDTKASITSYRRASNISRLDLHQAPVYCSNRIPIQAIAVQ